MAAKWPSVRFIPPMNKQGLIYFIQAGGNDDSDVNLEREIQNFYVGRRGDIAPEWVHKIRRLHATGKYSQRHIAKKCKISQATVNHVISGKVWKWK
jgi:hypothetical protein